MEEMDDILEIAAILMGPNGCPWDAKQTFYSLQKHFLEEVHEVVEAIDEQDPAHILEELGDIFYIVLFAAKIAEKQGLFSLKDVILQQKEKLIRRHPHVFSEEKCSQNISMDELEKRWDEIKQEEKAGKSAKNIFTNSPKGVPVLLASQKILRKLTKDQNFSILSAIEDLDTAFQKKFFYLLYQEVLNAEVDVEGEVRRGIRALEKAYYAQEKIPPEIS